MDEQRGSLPIEARITGTRRLPRGLVVAAGLLLPAAALVGVVPLLLQPPSQPEIRLWNGVSIQVRAVTFGRETRVVGSPLQQFLYLVLPAGEKERSGAVAFTGNTPGALTFWTVLRAPNSMSMGLHAAVLDEQGNASPSQWTSFSTDTPTACEFAAFPRRGREVRLCLYHPMSGTADRWETLGMASLPNPATGAFPQWNPPPLPATAHAGSLAVTLSRLERDENPGDLIPAYARCRARYRLTERGKPSANWTALLTDISDATGNTWAVDYADTATPTGPDSVFMAPQAPGERAWKLRFRLARTPTASYAASEVWEVPEVPVPAPGVALPLGKKATVQGMPLELVGVYGPGARLPAGFRFGKPYRTPVLLLRIRNPSARGLLHSLLPIRDDRGRALHLGMAIDSGDGDERHVIYRIDSPPGVRRFTFRYAVQPVRYVEITAPLGSAGRPPNGPVPRKGAGPG